MSKTRWGEVYSLEFKVKFSLILLFGPTVGWIPSSEAKGCVVGLLLFSYLSLLFLEAHSLGWGRREGEEERKVGQILFGWHWCSSAGVSSGQSSCWKTLVGTMSSWFFYWPLRIQPSTLARPFWPSTASPKL